MFKKGKAIILPIIIAASLLLLFALLGADLAAAVRACQINKMTKSLYPVNGAYLFDQLIASALAEEDSFILDLHNFQIESAPSSTHNPKLNDLEDEIEWVQTDLSEEPPEIQDDFKALFDANQDIVGWLTVGEQTDNPVVQRDNDYYLTHNFFGRSDSNGTLFLNQANHIWPRDKILLIHGHALRTGQMFGSLRKYKDEAYVRTHPIITFRTVYEDAPHCFVPIAGFDASMEMENRWFFDVLQFNFASPEEQTNYLELIQSLSYWHTPVKTETNDNLLILITCSYMHSNGRFILICRELRKEETIESVSAVLNNEAWVPVY